jgi:restriction endonuclease Mrr
MPIPDYQSLMLPVLRFARDRKEHSVAESRQSISAEFNLSEQELAERLASDSQTVFANRIGWAVQYLKAAVGGVQDVASGSAGLEGQFWAMFAAETRVSQPTH